MKALLTAVLMMFAAVSFAAEPAKKADAKTVQNDNCVKKDKNGKCPPLPDSPKPTPKKVEKKDDKKAEAAKK
jgi:hypothetical protein